MATLKLKKLNKVYPNGVQAVFDFDLDIKDREFIAFVGPSGCGKSTTLRMIAGLEEITEGELYIDDILVNDVPPKDRNIAMVFQSYALYPHMTVYDNMAFGLKLRKVPKDIIEEKVYNAAEILGLVPYLRRKPKALSGGQRQRVALGRAIVRDARVFLMDEPLSNLDAKLRVQTRGELIKLHKSLQTTTIYVTHDQIEAMTMADRIAVMKDGYIMQVGTPKEIYDNPNNIFVGGFIGTPPMNFIRGKISKDGYFEVDRHKLKVPQGKLDLVKKNDMFDTEIVLGIRPEDIHDDKNVFATYPEAVVDIEVDVVELLGAETHIYSNLGEYPFSASVDARYDIRIGDKTKLVFDMNKCHFFDPESEQRLTLDGNVKEIRKEMKRLETERIAKEQAAKAELERLKVEDPEAYEKRLAEIRRHERQLQREAKKANQKLGDEKPGLIERISNFFKERKEKKAQKKEEESEE
ncbi:MAG TPA: sn-glycerol-3-phosphate ABC transporter ATP-binding protein UgpC [Acholeplasmataceae bacterium]|jgi:multiple sugar transport system ATP-binding protein|nr:sn-glycerol-3-phosphate ABC transporter ATP-binding protein UgpC [Acholeplasmataceae bacterium]HPX71688.1 sn-glycerol-3-phosphate ABC transporter ATP-binding protein UgpC [Acholeplasmataceae bacterium]HQC30703.1 sn-glycerol-3-phosphate ABC transporter ATP-binding protein UgpC [Acholeplasmataceae bacterium]